MAAIAGGVAFVATSIETADETDDNPARAEAAAAVDAAGSAPAPGTDAPDGMRPVQVPREAGEAGDARSLDEITWTVAMPSTLDALAAAWTLPRDTLLALNPSIPTAEPLAVGTEIVVHRGTFDGSESVGPPNDGRLLGGVPFPEGRAWSLPQDRTRAFGTGETIRAVLAALDAYAARYPGAAPIRLGELSARRGGPISGHQSHQAGRDIDIRLVAHIEGDRFDAERNWFLVKTLIDGAEVVAIYLNRSQQVWLRAAAEAELGRSGADRYFALIKHESGHTIHIHVRFRCPDSDRRCVAYSLGETDEEVAKVLNKLPSKLPGGGGSPPPRNNGKLPTLRPKPTPKMPSPKLPRSPAKGR